MQGYHNIAVNKYIRSSQAVHSKYTSGKLVNCMVGTSYVVVSRVLQPSLNNIVRILLQSEL